MVASARARCPGAGCGVEGSLRALAQHIRGCVAYAELYRQSSGVVMDPVEAYRLTYPPVSAHRNGKPHPDVPVVEVLTAPSSVVVEVWEWPFRLLD